MCFIPNYFMLFFYLLKYLKFNEGKIIYRFNRSVTDNFSTLPIPL